MSKEPTSNKNTSLYAALFCATVLLLIGIYLVLTQNAAVGINEKDRFSEHAGTPIAISGQWIIYIAAAIGIIPAYLIINDLLKKKI